MNNGQKHLLSMLILSLLVVMSVSFSASAALKLSDSALVLEKGQTQALKLTGTKKTITWSSSKTSVATVDANGTVTGVKTGNAVITASVAGKSLSAKVKVLPSIKSLTLNKTKTTLILGKSRTLKLSILPKKDETLPATWTSSNKKVATVNQKGKITAKGIGKAKVTVTVGTKSVTCTVTVKKKTVAVDSLTLNKSTMKLYTGSANAKTLTAEILPETAKDEEITWTSSNKKVATVDDNGKVTGVKKGKAVILAKVGDKTATCTVTVKTAPVLIQSLSLDKTVVVLKVGMTTRLKATVLPSNTTDKTVKWKSSDKTIVKVSKKGNLRALKAGSATITATSGTKTATCTVTVVTNGTGVLVQTGISAVCKYTSVKEGYTFSASDFTVYNEYEGGGKEETKSFTVKLEKDTTKGSYLATVISGDYRTQINIPYATETVSTKNQTGITASCIQDKVEEGYSFTTTDFVVSAVYEDKTTEQISSFSIKISKLTESQVYKATITSGDYTTTVEVPYTSNTKTVTGMRAEHNTGSVEDGHTFTTGEFTVYLTYSDGSEETSNSYSVTVAKDSSGTAYTASFSSQTGSASCTLSIPITSNSTSTDSAVTPDSSKASAS